MSGLRPSSAHVTRRVRKKGSGRKRDASLSSLSTRRGSLGCPVDRYHRTSFPLLMDLPNSDGEYSSSHSAMDTSEPLPDRECFEFLLLPDVCKLRIWSFLRQCDLGRCMLVCADWYVQIQKAPQLWSSVCFSELPYSCLPRDRAGPIHREPVCHHCFKKRVYSFSHFLSCVQPVVREFQFCLDVSHPSDQFIRVIEQFMATAKLTHLRFADINWKESPSRVPIRGSQETVKDFLYRFRRRQRIFVSLFDSFTLKVPNLTTLVVPFDWSERSVENLCRLTNLQVLVLERYGVYSQYYNQERMDKLLSNLVNLRKLLPELWLQSVSGVLVQHLESASLNFLDLSQCRGYYIRRMVTPQLEHLRIARRPWNNNLFIQAEQPAGLPCLWAVLSSGAPRLKDINGYSLGTNWMLRPSAELNKLLATICYCRRHKESNGIANYGM